MSFTIRSGQSVVQGDFSRLEELIRQLRVHHYVDVGVLGEVRTPEGESVAEYGAENEFGSLTGNPPKRSFIRDPLTSHQGQIRSQVEPRAGRHLADGKVRQIFADIGLAAEAVIQEAFDTRGGGSWPPNAPLTVIRKGSSAPLIDEGLLRRSVSSRVGP